MKELEYSEQFLAAWSKYPHCKKPYRSGKAASWKVWKRLKLDDAEHVLGWIEAYEPSSNGSHGFQVYLKLHDFNEEPPQSPSPPHHEHTDWSTLPSVQAHIKALADQREAEKVRLKPVRDLAAELYIKHSAWASYSRCLAEAKKRLR